MEKKVEKYYRDLPRWVYSLLGWFFVCTIIGIPFGLAFWIEEETWCQRNEITKEDYGR